MNNVTSETIQTKELSLDIVINSHCDLNCIGCFRFSPLCKEDKRIYDLTVFENDLKRLKELGFKIKRFSLNGGEPTLNKNLFEYAKIIDKIYPESDKNIFTNCKFLEICKDDFLQNLKKHNLAVIYTNYVYSKIKYAKILDRLDKFGIIHFNVPKYFLNLSSYKPAMNKFLTTEPNHDPFKNLEKCLINCLSLRNSKLYRCGLLTNIDKMNEKFGCDFKVSETDVLDIFKLENPEQLFELLDKPLDFCKYCNIPKLQITKWRKSKCEKTEWILNEN